MILAADIGGTKSWLSLCEWDAKVKGAKPVYEALYASADFDDFTSLLQHFLQAAELEANHVIDTMCLALPGVINNGRCRLTNLDWALDREALQSTFTIPTVLFVNDFQAAAIGTKSLKADDFICLNAAAVDKKAITVVTGAGTGLGMAWMDSTQASQQLFSTEGGHCDFAPTTVEQMSLLRFLLEQYEHVSYERILSGAGLVQLYRFYQPDHKQTTQEINALARQGNAEANAAIRLFVAIYAAYIGNLALLYKPAGGIYIAGGIAKHILPWMQEKAFINHYLHKGRMRHLAENTAVFLVTNNRLGLEGAILLAQIEMEGRRL
ncbi:MAG: glucokinase [Thiotrichaceae bacterium]|nr:glucokinase [Thiotrichaceae bacterium]